MATILLIRHGQASYGQADYDKLSPRGIEQAKLVGTWLATQHLDALFAGPLTRQRETAQHAREAAPTLPPAVELAELAEYPGFEMVKAFMPKLVEEEPELAMLVSKPTRDLTDERGSAPRGSAAAGSAALIDKAFHLILGKWSRDEWRIAGVERVHEFAERVTAGLDRIVAACGSGGRVAVVTSAGPIGVAVGLVFGATSHHMIRASSVVKNASITELKIRTREFAWHPDKVSLVGFNSVAHLPADLQTEY